jgi:predicted RNA-binding protein with TRAM domain
MTVSKSIFNLILLALIIFSLITSCSSGNGGGSDSKGGGKALPNSITRDSVSSIGSEGNDNSRCASINYDGRYVSFFSWSDNLIDNDTNSSADVFVRDRLNNETTRISVDSNGVQGNGGSLCSAISGDGRYAAFISSASNLVSNDSNSYDDVFIHDMQTGQTKRISVDSSGNQGNGDTDEGVSINNDGRYVAFDSTSNNLVANDTNNRTDIFVHDSLTGETTRVSVDSNGAEGNSGSYNPSISGNGRYVAFASLSSNLVLNDTNDSYDVFVHDLQTGETRRVSVDSYGTEGNSSSDRPSISYDGQYITFHSIASNFVAGDTNNYYDVFVHDTQTGETVRVSVDANGQEMNNDSELPSISDDGRYISYQNGIELYVYDQQSAKTFSTYLDPWFPKLSGNGNYITFSTGAFLVPDDKNNMDDIYTMPLK